MAAVFDTIFAAALNVAQAAQDAVYAHAYRLEPRRKPPRTLGDGSVVPDVNAASVADPSRPVVAFRASLIAKGALLHAHGRSMADSTTRPIVAESPILDAAEADAPALRDDVVVCEASGARFVVTRVVPQELGRSFIHLAEAP